MAKFCENCGAPLGEQEKFCANCGARVREMAAAAPAPAENSAPASQPVNNTPVQEPVYTPPVQPQEPVYTPVYTPPAVPAPQKVKKPRKKMSRGKKVKIILLSVLAVVLAAALALVGVYFLGGPYDVYQNIKDQNYYEARTEYSREVSGSAVKRMLLKAALSSSDTGVADAFKAGTLNYSDAVQALEVLEYVGLGDMTALIDEISALNEVNTAVANGNEYYKHGDYENALLEYAKIDAGSEAYASVQEKINSALSSYKTDALNRAQSAIDAQDYAGALQILSAAMQVAKDDTELTNLYNSAATTYEQISLQQATEYFNAKQFNEAQTVLNQALGLLPNSQALQNKRDEIEAKKPDSLTELTMINSKDWKWNEGAPVDPFGNDYSGASNYVLVDGNVKENPPYGEFRLYKNYSTFTGTIAPYSTFATDEAAYVQIYVDDTLVYTSPVFDRKTDAFTFSVNVTGAEYLKIAVFETGNYWADTTAILSNLMVYR